VLLIILQVSSNAQGVNLNRKNPKVKTRISVSPMLGLYFPNQHHASNAHQKMAFSVSIKEEIRLSKHYRDYLWIGAEYLYHGVGFKSYYFYEDSLQLYTPDRERFDYNLTIHEVDIPIQFKHSFNKETDALVSAYVFGGYSYRMLIASHVTVSENGNDIINKPEQLTFKTPTFMTTGSSFLNMGFGVQKNNIAKHRAVFAELQFKYATSPFQFNERFTPSSMFINGHFILITVGFKI